MPLKCSKVDCFKFVLVEDSQLAFYQDLHTSGWNLALGPEFVVHESPLPSNIGLVQTGNSRFPYDAVCPRCLGKIAKVNSINGFRHHSVNFSGKKVSLVHSHDSHPPFNQKWLNVMSMFPDIRRITATIESSVPLVGCDTIHFHGVKDLEDIINAGGAVSRRSGLYPRNYQWRSYFFSCFNNVLLCLPTGMGKTLIATMLMKAYQRRNVKKGQTFIVPTVVLVEQQAAVIERHTGLKVIRRSGEQNQKTAWSSNEICVCTPAMLLNAIKIQQVDMSQQSLLILDEVHEASSPLAPYGLLLPYILKCAASQRPRVLGLSASPSSSNTFAPRESISSLCKNLLAVPYTPLIEDNSEGVKSVNVEFVGVHKTRFEEEYEAFVFGSLEKLSSCHDFFATNWKTLLHNVPTKNKVDIAIKTLSHSKAVAQTMADTALFELTQWMKKWIDSLDLLQIFGPKKLIEFIEADLKFFEKKETLRRISPRIFPFLVELQSSMQRLVANNFIQENSPKLEQLLRRLKEHINDEERILIFVNRRSTAERLCRKLKSESELDKMNPMYIVGNSTSNFPKELQQSILEMFSKGECRALISTSVLEQGIDVAACGLVICFDGIKSVKSTIQSRGRARKSVASFVAFVASEEQRQANELTQMEMGMHHAIKQLMIEYKSDFDVCVKEQIENFLDSDLAINENEYFDVEDEDDNEVLVEGGNVLQLRFFNFVNSKPIVEALVDHIENCFSSPTDRVVVKPRLIYAQFSVTEIESDSKIIREVSSFASKQKNSRLCSWFDVSYNHSKNENKGFNDGIGFRELRGFYFKDFVTVVYDSHCIWFKEFKFNVRNNEIILSTESDRFSIRAIDIDGSILIHDTNEYFEIFLCLRIPPHYFQGNELANYDFQHKSFNLSLKRNFPLDSKTAWNIRKAFENLNIQVYNVCNLRKENIEETQDSFDNSVDFQKNYLIQTWHSTHANVLPTILPKSIMTQLYNCGSVTNLTLLLNNVKPIRFHKLYIECHSDVEFPHCSTVSDDYFLCARVKITPYRYIFTGLEPMPKNRIYRYFPNPDNFLTVSFSDEYGENPWRSSHVVARFSSILKTHISVGGKKFTFLGCSNSQLREGRCWFSTLDRQVVYDKIGQFPRDWSAGRKLTRLALAFAASVETVALDYERYLKTVAPDVKIGDINFSDGIGRGSRKLFQELAKIMDVPAGTSAFQIRVGGIKGVISVYDDQEEDVMFRESMKKFVSAHNMLEVLNYSRPIRLRLNRHVILLLASFGVPDDVFLAMQKDVLMENINTLISNEASFNFVASHTNIFNWHLFPREHLVREPFFRQMLLSNITNLIAGITNHSQIPVSKGRVLMGVLDETRTLKYGEIYANIVEENEKFELEGKVLVFRNPCVLPSDIRVLNAYSGASASRLKKLYQNCLVIPAQGPDSHARECAGGDLDGDLYYVIWDEKLIPKSLNVPGEKIVEVVTEVLQPTSHNSNDSITQMLNFFCDYVSKNRLGVIANAHLAVSDALGMRHPQSVELARYVAAETDAPKRETACKINQKLLPTSYPDFMQKLHKPMYKSKTVLGKLYHNSKPFFEIFLEKRAAIAPSTKFNFTGDSQSIEIIYESYSFEINTLLQRFNLASEVDLFSGTPMWQEDYLSTYKEQNQLRETLNKNMQTFWEKWNFIFEKWRSKVVNNNKEKILEWYGKPRSTPWPLHSFSFLALPFVSVEACKQKSISKQIFETTKLWVYQNKIRWLSEWRLRARIGQTIMEKLNGIECQFYGSSVLGLSEEFSDIDFYSSENNFAKLRSMLVSLDGNATEVKKPHACVTLSVGSLNIDVTNFKGGVTKTYAIAEVFDKNPTYWSALRVLIEWARTVQIVKSCGSEGLMKVVSFCHLFISFATGLPPPTESEEKPYSLIQLGNWIESVQNPLCAELIYKFLTFLSGRNSREWLLAVKDPFTNEALIKTDLIENLCTKAELALMLLAVHNGDVRKLFQFCTKERLFRLDRRYCDPKDASEEKKRICLTEIKTACDSKTLNNLLIDLVERNGVFYVEVIGDYKHMAAVEKKINSILNKVANTRTRFNTLRYNAFHVKNSTTIIPEFGNGPYTNVSFSTYNGDLYTARHTGLYKSRITVCCAQQNINWRTTEYQRYKVQFLRQIQLFREKRLSNVNDIKLRRFFGNMQCNIRCGNYYFFNVPETLHNSFEALTLLTIEEKVSHLEEALDLERINNIIHDVNDSLTLIQSYDKIDDQKPLILMPLNEMKNRFTEQQKKNDQIFATPTDKKTNVIRHAFHPAWLLGLEHAKKFAAQHGFKEVRPASEDFYVTITVFWRARELVIKSNKNGMIIEIRHRSTRWLSASFQKFGNEGGGDVRVYLESRAGLDEDESCVETVVEYLHERSIFTETFAKQIKNFFDLAGMEDEPVAFIARPLIPDIFRLNWKFRSMRVVAPVLKFVNSDNDVLWLHQIYDGIFHFQRSEFDWFSNHFEYEMSLNMEIRNNQDLCEKSYDYSISLFDYTKRFAAA